jgi:hypothetical protein
MTRIILTVLAIFFLSTLPAEARDWYASPAGRDGAPATAEAPASIISATRNAAAGDTIILRKGEYALAQQVFLEKENLTLKAFEGERPVLKGPIDNKRFQNVLWLSAKGCKAIGLEIVGGNWYSVKMEAPECVLRDCRIHGSGHDAVKMTRAHKSLIESCEIYDTGRVFPSNAEGIDNVAGDDLTVRGCYIHHTTTNGIYMKGSAWRNTIEGCLVTDTGHNGIMLGQSTDKNLMRSDYECLDSVARNNVVMRTDGAGLAFEAAANCRFENNTLIDVARVRSVGIAIQPNEHGTPCKDVIVTGNAVSVSSARPMLGARGKALASMSDLKCDDNRYYRASGPYTFEWDPTDKVYSGLANWQQNTPYDAHSTILESPPEVTWKPAGTVGGRAPEDLGIDSTGR